MSKHKLELYFYFQCPYCQRVLDRIEQLKIQDKVSLKNILEDKSSLDKLITDTGRRTVPCLYIDGKPMHESSDIMNWLSKNYS